MEEHKAIHHKIRFKLIYLTEQVKLLDLNMEATETLIEILEKCKEKGGRLERNMYDEIDVRILRVIRKYLLEYEQQLPYILYQQK